MTHPSDYPQILGTGFATRNGQPVVVVGERVYSKYDLGRIGCPHITSARQVNSAMTRLGVSSLEELAKRYSPRDFVALKGFGVTAFYALICLLRDAKINVGQFYKEKMSMATYQHQVRQSASEFKRRTA